MKRKILIISLIIITLISCILYYTYAIDITMEKTSSSEADLAYNININDTDGRSITVNSNTIINSIYSYNSILFSVKSFNIAIE